MEQQTANWDHCLQYAAVSNVGLRRANNQDSMTVTIAGSQETFCRRGHLFMVADGMGAHAAGELASKLATDTVALTYSKLLDMSPPEALLTAIRDANAQIHGRGQANFDFKGMGTTSTVLLLLPQGAMFGQVGDSRAYLLRGERFQQMTFDHSLVWEMQAAGQIPRDQVPDYVPKNVITRSLGPNPAVQVDLEGPFPVQVGDTFLLCSDGLSGPVSDNEMGTIIGCLPPDEAVQTLVDLANLRGGPDNITAIVVRVTAPLVARLLEPESHATIDWTMTRPVHPLLWTLLGVSGLAAIAAAVTLNWGLALICLGILVVGTVTAMIQRFAGAESNRSLPKRPLGKGPYTACDCPPTPEFIQRLAEILDPLRETARSEDWTVDWNRLETLRTRASAAEQSGNYAEAVAENFRAISFMMAQRKHPPDLGGDSGVLGP